MLKKKSKAPIDKTGKHLAGTTVSEEFIQQVIDTISIFSADDSHNHKLHFDRPKVDTCYTCEALNVKI